MNFEYYIARRIHFAQGGRGVSRPAVRIATAGMALGLAVMLVAVAVITGFKREIRDKAAGFGGHVQVSNFDNNNTYEARPIRMDTATQRRVENVPGVRHVQRVATKPGIIKTADEFQGIVLKGVGADFDWAFFADNLTAGHTLDTHSDTLRNEVVISEWLARRLGLDVGDTFFTYFIQENVRARRFTIHTMKLVGASWAFIRRPFLMRNFWVGLLSGMAADVVLLSAAYALVHYEPSLMAIITPETMLWVSVATLVFGLLITYLCAYISINKYLRLSASSLYYM